MIEEECGVQSKEHLDAFPASHPLGDGILRGLERDDAFIEFEGDSILQAGRCLRSPEHAVPVGEDQEIGLAARYVPAKLGCGLVRPVEVATEVVALAAAAAQITSGGVDVVEDALRRDGLRRGEAVGAPADCP
ncbi:hypothetical protein F4553_005333 [Allocatelliglobosispora scoriae]|uniref:Uncharacterized protein n=1 Tax=Allocatelliglobosispora scoriae TaxID=643052 RepID=A0A841BUS8_9ACTN|nr:hypothetical protein [Allocatelliglobosispora scoriae]MBB5871954.1 hypothetical protein [Allocatelliglobosispora scoriae]